MVDLDNKQFLEELVKWGRSLFTSQGSNLASLSLSHIGYNHVIPVKSIESGVKAALCATKSKNGSYLNVIGGGTGVHIGDVDLYPLNMGFTLAITAKEGIFDSFCVIPLSIVESDELVDQFCEIPIPLSLLATPAADSIPVFLNGKGPNKTLFAKLPHFGAAAALALMQLGLLLDDSHFYNKANSGVTKIKDRLASLGLPVPTYTVERISTVDWDYNDVTINDLPDLHLQPVTAKLLDSYCQSNVECYGAMKLGVGVGIDFDKLIISAI